MPKLKQDLFAFLKDRKIFTSGGHKTLREYLSAQENQTLLKLASRKVHKKKRAK